MKGFFQKNWILRLLALLFTLLLFFNANSQKNSSSSSSTSTNVQTRSVKLANVPVNILGNDKYFYSGYEGDVTVQLSSTNLVKLGQQENEDTRTFKVVADLRKTKKTGTMDMVLTTRDLPSGIEAQIDPKTTSITVEKKASKEFKITPVVAKAQLADDYTLKEISVSPKTVKITTGEAEIAQIARVEASVNPTEKITGNYSEKVTIKAYDADGNALPIAASPAQATVSLKVSLPSKSVPLQIEQTGTAPAGVSSVEVTADKNLVKLSGDASQLADIESVALSVDISNIKQKTTKTMKIPVESGITADPTSVEVTITPTAASTHSS